MKSPTATLPEIVFGILRSIEGLESIKPKDCCEYIIVCEDTMIYLTKREEVSSSEENKEYQALECQIKNLCTHGAELREKTLRCGLRDKYLGVENGT